MVYNLDFDTQTESVVYGIDDAEKIYIGNIGGLLCRILSGDYLRAAIEIPDMILRCVKEKLSFPRTEITEILSTLFLLPTLGSYRDIDSILTFSETAYKAGRNTGVTEHDEEFCKRQIFMNFSLFIALQSYVENIEYSSNMTDSDFFESFAINCLNTTIPKNLCVESCEDYSMLNMLACPVQSAECRVNHDRIDSIVRDHIDSMGDFDKDHIHIETYRIVDLILLSIYYLLKHGYTFKRCKNCGRLFVPISRSDEIYCNSISPQDETKTCKKYGSDRLWYENLKKDEAAKLSRNVYMSKQMLVKRNPDITAYADMYEYFKSERKKWVSDIKAGIKTREEYIAWLNVMKQKKTL